MFVAFIAASIVLRDSRLTSTSGDTRQLLDQNTVTPLPPFPLYAAFPRSEYYGGSDAIVVHRLAACLQTIASRVHRDRLYETM
jgi:hypothetical protein